MHHQTQQFVIYSHICWNQWAETPARCFQAERRNEYNWTPILLIQGGPYKMLPKLFKMLLHVPWRGSENYAPWRGAYSAPPPAISAPRSARNTKLGGWVGPHKNSLWCKFGDPRSTFSRSNDVINAKFSHFLVKRAALCLSRSRAQTNTDSFDLQRREDA